MKNILSTLFVICFLFVANKSFAQDLIYFKNGNETKAKVIEVLSDQIKYKKWENQTGPTYSGLKSEIFKIKYISGSQDVFNTNSPTIIVEANDNSNLESRKNNAVFKLEKFIREKINESEVIELKSFKKTNGTISNLGGTIYNVEFDVNIHFKKIGYLVGNGLQGYWKNDFYIYPQPPDLRKTGFQYAFDVKSVEAGSNFILGCTAILKDSDNGFIIDKNSVEIKNITTLNSTNVKETTTQNKISTSNSQNEVANVESTKVLNQLENKKPIQPKIKWITIDQAFEAIKKEPRKIVIDVYTDWCGWCKVMDKNTFSDAKVADFVNKKYYAVKLNAEQGGEIKIGDKKYTYPELAAQLMQNRMSYPTIVYLDEKFNMIQPIPGYQDAKAFHQVITFLGDNHFKKIDFEKYKAEKYEKAYQ